MEDGWEDDLSCDDPLLDDDDDSEVGGWLDEVPDLQMRVVLMANSGLRSYFGFQSRLSLFGGSI